MNDCPRLALAFLSFQFVIYGNDLCYVFLKPFKGVRSRSHMPIVHCHCHCYCCYCCCHSPYDLSSPQHGSFACLTCFCLFVVVVTLSHTPPLTPSPYLYKVPRSFPFSFSFSLSFDTINTLHISIYYLSHPLLSCPCFNCLSLFLFHLSLASL